MISGGQFSQSNEFDSNSNGNMTVFNFPGKEGMPSSRPDGILRHPVSLLSSSRDDPPISGKNRYIQSNNQYGTQKGPKTFSIPATAGNLGIGSLGSPRFLHDKFSHSNERFQDSHRIPGQSGKILNSPLGIPSSFRDRNSSTANGVKIRGVQNRN
jgi:hypothetical protein